MEIGLAQQIGTHALVAYLAGLATVLALVTLLWLILRHVERFAGHAAPPRRILILRAAIGFAIVVATGFAFAEMSEARDVREAMGRFDVALADTLRAEMSPTNLVMFALVTRLGDVGTITVLCVGVAFLVWSLGRRSMAMIWVLAVTGNAVLNEVLKNVFERARPIHEHGLLTAEGWSFPSGHSSGAVVTYGMLACLAASFVPARWQLPLLLAAAWIAFTTGLSRAMLQVHWASDVLAGFASGLMWLTVCVLSSQWVQLRYANE